MRRWSRAGWAATLILLLILALTEVCVRSFGLVDFPIYNVDDKIGFIVKENQKGLFLNKNDWYFNDKNMPIQRNWDDNAHPNVLLIGNSVIMGGISFRQQEKLTALLQDRLGKTPVVWPIAIGGWTDVNEIVYLDRHPEIVAKADYIAWEYMYGGLSRTSPWAGEYVFPSHRPFYATWYLFRRYVVPRLLPFLLGSELPATGEAIPANIQNFDEHVGALVRAAHRSEGGFIWFYPTAEQLRDARNQREWLPERPQIVSIAEKNGLRIVDIAAFKEWNLSLYQPDGVHPTVAGNAVLATILSQEIRKDQK